MAKRFARVRRRYSPRRRLRRFRRGKAPIALLPTLTGVVYPVMDSANNAGITLDTIMSGNLKSDHVYGFIDQISQHYTGFAPWGEHFGVGTWHFDTMAKTYLALALGIAGSKLATKFGVNAQMRKIPMLGKFIKL